MKIPIKARPLWAGTVLILLAGPRPGVGQEASTAALEAHLEIARAENPEIRAAVEAVGAARARAGAAGLLPDPRLGVGLANALVSEPLSSEDFMTMRVVQVGQRVPYPGKLGLEREIAAWRLAAAEAERDRVELAVVAAVRRAWYEIFFLDRAREVVRHNHELLADFASITQARYGVGTGGQPDVLKAQVEKSRLGEELLALAERRAAEVARLNALLDRPSETPIAEPAIPGSVERAALPEEGARVRFTAVGLDATGDPGPIPDLATLQARAERESPVVHAHVAQIEAQAAAARLAAKAALPDFDLALGYGQRGGREDMLMAIVSIPIPVRKGARQDALAAAERGELARQQALHHAMVNDLHAEVAELHASLVRTRDRLALLRDGVLPQARASLESATAGYPVASVDFLTLLDSQATLFRHELDYHRLLSRFAQDLAELERVVGGEVLR